MSETPDWDSAWQGLEPQQPRPRRGCYNWALAATVFLTLGVLALAVFARQRSAGTDTGLVLPGTEAPPTVASGETPAEATSEATPSGPGLAATATLPGELLTPSPQPVPDVTAGRFAPILDGDPSDWSDIPANASPYTVFTGDGWDGSDDLGVVWQVAWDDAYLYFAFNINDEIHSQSQTGSQTFRGDSIELQIDTNRDGDFGPSLNGDDFQVSLSPGDFGGLRPSAWLFQGTDSGGMTDAPAGNAITVAARQVDGGYTLEAAIPWSDLRIVPSPGMVLGLAVNANDNDHPGTAAQELMKSNVPGRRFGDPTSWGTLTLQ